MLQSIYSITLTETESWFLFLQRVRISQRTPRAKDRDCILKLNLENKGYGVQAVYERKKHSPALHKNKINVWGTSNKTLT